jgi:hypothetical protein
MLAANPKRATRTVTGLLLEANWKDNTAEVYPDEGSPVKLAFPDELADAIESAVRRRVRVTGSFRRPRNGRQHLEVDEVEVAGRRSPLAGLLARAAAPAATRDPFAGAKPIEDVSALLGGLPDERSAEEIIADMEACEVWHRPPYDDEEEG